MLEDTGGVKFTQYGTFKKNKKKMFLPNSLQSRQFNTKYYVGVELTYDVRVSQDLLSCKIVFETFIKIIFLSLVKINKINLSLVDDTKPNSSH